MGDALNPSPLSRLSRALNPDWVRTTAARRAIAAALVILAAVAALRDDPDGTQVAVVVAVRDLTPGIELTADDVRIENRSAPTVPENSPERVDTVVGRTLAGPVRRGEVLADVRLLGPRLAEAAVGPDARIVPLPLADSAVLDLIRSGDVVDIVAAASDAEARVIATGAVVVLVSAKESGVAARGDGRVVLVALPAPAARTVAGAALVQAIAITLH